MTTRSLWCAVLIVALCLGSAVPARADSLKTAGDEILIGIVAAAAAVVVLTIVVVHYSKKRTITGCVSPAGNGLALTDEKDNRIYTLSGSAAGVTAGERVKLQGKKLKPQGHDQPLAWDTAKMVKDFGACAAQN
jgi:hypothetical protein